MHMGKEDLVFEAQCTAFWQEQMQTAEGQRRENIMEKFSGTKLLLKAVIWPVFQSFDELVLEHEMKSLAKVYMYVDVFHTGWGIAFEEDNFITHAEKVSRGRFSFERRRARSVGARGKVYFPYSRDELVKTPELCRSDLLELLDFLGSMQGSRLLELPPREREVIRCAKGLGMPFRRADVEAWLWMKPDACSRLLHSMEKEGLVARVAGGEHRAHAYELTEKAWSYTVFGGAMGWDRVRR